MCEACKDLPGPSGENMRGEALKRQREVRELAAKKLRVQQAIAAVEADPNNATANLFLGRLYCITEGDWERGLQHLAKGSDQLLATLASQDVAPPSDPAAQVALADEYWDAAQDRPQPDKNALLVRAAHWYRKARSALDGLSRARADKRLREAALIRQKG